MYHRALIVSLIDPFTEPYSNYEGPYIGHPMPTAGAPRLDNRCDQLWRKILRLSKLFFFGGVKSLGLRGLGFRVCGSGLRAFFLGVGGGGAG